MNLQREHPFISFWIRNCKKEFCTWMSNWKWPIVFNIVSFITNGGGVMMSVTWRICLYSSTIVYPPFCPFSELSTSKKGEVDNGEGVMEQRCKIPIPFLLLILISTLPDVYSSTWPTCKKDMIIVQVYPAAAPKSTSPNMEDRCGHVEPSSSFFFLRVQPPLPKGQCI